MRECDAQRVLELHRETGRGELATKRSVMAKIEVQYTEKNVWMRCGSKIECQVLVLVEHRERFENILGTINRTVVIYGLIDLWLELISLLEGLVC